MKLLLSIALTLIATAALADIPRPTPNPATPLLTVIKEGSHSVKLVLPKCATDPVVRCAAMPSVVLELVLPLVGCVDSAHVSYSVVQNQNNSDVKVTVSALNVSNPRSASTKCMVAPTAVKRIFLGGPRMQSKNVTVEFLQNAAN